MIYIITFTFVLLFAKYMRSYKTDVRGICVRGANRDFYIITTIVLLGAMALRGVYVGSDTVVYQYLFNRAQELSFGELTSFYKSELGFYYTTKVIGIIINNYQAFLLITGMVYIIPATRIIYKESENVLMSYFLFFALGFYTLAFSNIKEIMAIGICLIAYEISDKKVWSILLVLLAGTFHFSALIFLPVIFLDKIRLTKARAVIMVIIPIAIVAAFNYIVDFIIRIVLARNGEAYNITSVSGYGMLLFLMVSVALGIYVYFCNSFIRGEQDFVRLIYIMYVSLVIFISTRFNPAALRAYQYYFIFAVIYIPKLLNRIKNKNNKLIITTFFVLISLYYLVFKVFDDPFAESRKLLPYYFFWKDV